MSSQPTMSFVATSMGMEVSHAHGDGHGSDRRFTGTDNPPKHFVDANKGIKNLDDDEGVPPMLRHPLDEKTTLQNIGR